MQQEAEQKSLDQVAGFQKSLEAFSEGILLVDTSTPDWNVLFQNEAWLRITGMSRDEVYGSKLWHLFTPAGQTKVVYYHLPTHITYYNCCHALGSHMSANRNDCDWTTL